MNIMKIFEHEQFGSIRIVENDGDVWFIASDVAKALWYRRPNYAVNDYCKKDSKLIYDPASGKKKIYDVISEKDVITLIMRSNLHNAERFHDWIFAGVLPSIRKTDMDFPQVPEKTSDIKFELTNYVNLQSKKQINTSIKIFDHEQFGSIRIADNNGDPWFVAKDVCSVLELGNIGQATSSLDEDEKRSITINDGTPGSPVITIISESGMYSIVLRSRKPEAKAFKRWICHEVLPSIRKQGGYKSSYSVPKSLPEALRLAADLAEKTELAIIERDIAIHEKCALEQQVAIDQPHVEFSNAIGSSDDTILMATLSAILRKNGITTIKVYGEILSMGQNNLFKWMHENKYLRRNGKLHNHPTQKSLNSGILIVKESYYKTPNGRTNISITPLITTKGQRYFLKKFGVISDQSQNVYQCGRNRNLD